MTHALKAGPLGLFAALAIMAAPAAAMNDQSVGYVYDDNGQIVRDAAGDCARTVFWTFSNALAECDPDAVLEALERTTTDKAAADVNLVTRFRTVTETLQGGQEFKFDEDSLSRSAMAKLDRIGLLHGRVLLKQVSVFGHTDRLGDENYNKDLSRRRAEAAKLYLMKVGIPEDIISVIPVGSEDPVVTRDHTLCARPGRAGRCRGRLWISRAGR